jgi:hypothetical protein
MATTISTTPLHTKKQVVETTCESHEKNSITATILVDPGMSCGRKIKKSPEKFL